MSWNRTLITLDGANKLFSDYTVEFSHNAELGIYEARRAKDEHWQAKTLMALCQKVLSYLAD